MGIDIDKTRDLNSKFHALVTDNKWTPEENVADVKKFVSSILIDHNNEMDKATLEDMELVLESIEVWINELASHDVDDIVNKIKNYDLTTPDKMIENSIPLTMIFNKIMEDNKFSVLHVYRGLSFALMKLWY